MSRQNRRTFMQHASVAAVGVLASASAGPLAAIEHIARGFGSKFKFSLAAYSYRDLLTGKTPKMSLEDFISDCAAMGLEGTELTGYYFPAEPSSEYLNKLKQHCFRLGLDISGTAVGNDFCHPAGPERDKQIKYVKTWIDRAAQLGAPVIRIFSGQPHGQSKDDAQKLAIAAIEECCQYAGEHGVYLALENHGGLTAEVDDMLAIVKGVQSPWFGVNLDTGNFHSADLYGDLAKVAPYAVNVQVKVVVSGPSGKKEPSDFARLAEILKSSGYRGYIVLEYEEADDPRQACPKYIEQLRKAFATG